MNNEDQTKILLELGAAINLVFNYGLPKQKCPDDRWMDAPVGS